METFGSEKISVAEIVKRIINNFKLTPAGIVSSLGLKNSVTYNKTAAYGHFGREEFPWEKTDKVDALQ